MRQLVLGQVFLLLILLQDVGRENTIVFKTFPSTVLNCSEHMLHLLPKRQKTAGIGLSHMLCLVLWVMTYTLLLAVT